MALLWGYCSREYFCVPDSADLHRQIQESRESRRRAWAALQRVREAIARLSERPLPPPEKPPNFAKEGEALRAALLAFARSMEISLGDAGKAAEAMRPYLTASDDGSFPHKLIMFNRALGRLGEIADHCAYALQKLKP